MTTQTFMQRALQLAELGLFTTRPNPAVGCVIVKNGEIVGEGFHARAGERHAEIMALEHAGGLAEGADVYVTLEPCAHHGRTSPCVNALVSAGVKRVVAAMVDPNPKVAGRGFAALKSAGIAVEIGDLAAQAESLNQGFMHRMKTGSPYVRLKMAMSLDGKVALSNGMSQWITGETARRDAQYWRARSGAIITGIGTVLADDPRLTVRDIDVPSQPLRVILDHHARLPQSAKLREESGDVLLITTEKPSHSMSNLESLIVTHIDLQEVLHELGRREINDVLVEAGPRLCGAFLEANLVHELILYYAPKILGNYAKSAFELPALTALDQAIDGEVLEIQQHGADIGMRIKLSQHQQPVPRPRRG